MGDQSFKDLRFNGPRVAQYWMGNNPDLPDIWYVSTIQEKWATMPDGTNGVSETFKARYENGTVDYITQVRQSASWYTPTTPAAVHDNIHYNQIGYNEIGRESAHNALIMLDEIEAPEMETTVEFLAWDGFTKITELYTSAIGTSATLAVPIVSPVWRYKDVTYTVSEGLRYEYYDLLTDSELIGGTLTAVGAEASVSAAVREMTSYYWGFDGNKLVSDISGTYTKNNLTLLSGTGSNGEFNNMRYQTEQGIRLLHDKEWCLEIALDAWTATAGSMILGSDPTASQDQPYLYFRPSDFFVGFGYYDGAYYADGTKTATCDHCDATDTVMDEGSKLAYIRGDVNGDETLNSADAIYLLRHTIMLMVYPLAQPADMNGDGVVNSADAIYLLRHTIMPELYPLR